MHPARYLEDMPRKRITQKYLNMAAEILDGANDWLLQKVSASLLEAMEKEELEQTY